MTFAFRCARSLSRGVPGHVLGLVLLLFAGLVPAPSQAGPAQAAEVPADAGVRVAVVHPSRVVHIRDHRGGYLPRVVAELKRLNSEGATARIDGGFCFSACTVFLAADRVCVAPHTLFGFHAPRDAASGRVLTGSAFDQVTAHVADYYRPELAAWWMREGRHVHNGLVLRSGAELIAMGYPACPPARG